MKPLFTTALWLSVSVGAFGQHAYTYTYDQAGNRTSRQRINYAMANASPRDTSFLFSPAITMAYPNPTEGELMIKYDSDQEIERVFNVYDSQGKKCLERKTTTAMIRLNLASLPSGIYLIEAIENDVRTIWKISKK